MPIDTHMHLASSDLVAYPHASDKPLETDKYVNTAESFLQLMDGAGVDGALVVQAFGLYGFDNSYHADSAAKYPVRFAGVCGLSPFVPDAPGLLRYWIRERGMAGLRVSFYGANGLELDENSPEVLSLLEEATALNVPVCFLTTRKNLAAVHAISKKFPGLRIALDHLGVVLGKPERVRGDLLALAPAPNIYLKFSTPILTAGPEHLKLFHDVIGRFGVHRLMWGTDFPHTNVGGYTNMVNIARNALSHFTATEQHALFDGTAASLWPQLSRAKAPARDTPG